MRKNPPGGFFSRRKNKTKQNKTKQKKNKNSFKD